jgi:hypothetical protein
MRQWTLHQTACSLPDNADEGTAQVVMRAVGTLDNAAGGPRTIERIAFTGSEIATDLVGNALTGVLQNWT